MDGKITRDTAYEYGKLFAHQKQLPKLPVPDLQHTLTKYIESLEPILTKDEFNQAKHKVEEFGKSKQAHELQQRLKARAAEPERASWLEEWWNELSYMGYRDPVIPYVSYHYCFNDDLKCTRPAERAAKLLSGAIEFRQQVVDGSLEPEMLKDKALCSHSYKYMFNACRIPRIPSDYCRTVSYQGNEHIVVVRNAQFFSFSFKRDGRVLSVQEMEDTVQRIVEAADSEAAVPVGILTADSRDSWTETRRLLAQIPENAQVLEAIESSAFILVMESGKPVTREEFSHTVWHGDGRSRWFDKPCQFVVCDNARAGFCGEHSMMDGTPTLRLVEHVIAHSLHLPPSDVAPKSNVVFSKLTFHTPPQIVNAVKRAQSFFAAGVAKQHLRVLNFNAFGKEGIKRLKCSPDAFVQMAIQLAYVRLHGRPKPTYEASMTRKFLHGRTETCRSVTRESALWCRAMDDPSASASIRIKLLRDAMAKHTQLVREAVEGQGVDRHLLGLRMLVRRGEQMPRIFEDHSYSYSSHWFISTSQISSENFTSYGWSEVTPKGYGVAYNIRSHSLLVHIACMRNEHGLNSDYFAQYFETAACDMRMLLSGPTV
ncbi:Carnitine O-acetyltransferase mitochondrial [Coemansia brasiliensis]|uniref:Carnitine O-acetyltransferase, mitochondrial n=1 Tax=Coemansia brasiliensis TaxID=2650707 RepID=A0A9W8IBW4_9FUNG|nr:Carnitine O-acetyltransferase mitochondrial [Coemansia brasiliensis]